MDQFKKQKKTRRVSQIMGRQRNNPQLKEKKEFTRRMLKEIYSRKLSDIEFKTMVIRKINELSVNYQNLQGNSRGLLQIISGWKRT